MPRIVDHDARRREIAAVVEQLVYDSGIEALTVRDIAKAAGCSTSIVSHYFGSKLEMLVFTHREARLRAEAALEQALAAGANLAAALGLLLPTTDATWRDWHTWFAFWGMAPADPAVDAEWIDSASGAHRLLTALVHQAQARGEIPATRDADDLAHQLRAMVIGLASLAALDRKGWPPERQRALFTAMLAKLIA